MCNVATLPFIRVWNAFNLNHTTKTPDRPTNLFLTHMVYNSPLTASLNHGSHSCRTQYLHPVGYFIYRNYSWRKNSTFYVNFCTPVTMKLYNVLLLIHWNPDKTMNKSMASTMQKCMLGYPWYLRKLALLTRGNSLSSFQNIVLLRVLLYKCM